MEENLKQNPLIGKEIIKIALFGPESTGKTTLARQLAIHFETVWTPEFARDYLQQKWNSEAKTCELEDLLPIAGGQVRLENEALLKANKHLFCDTTLMVTKVFSEMYYNYCDPVLDKAARKHKYDLFFLTDVDMPWTKDDLRDRPENRCETFEIFKSALIENNKPFIVLSGNEQQRFQQAVTIVDNFERAKKAGFSSYDFVQLYHHGLVLENIEQHLKIFQKGTLKTVIDRPAVKDDGITRFTETQHKELADFFDSKKNGLKLEKFVPASGAATRMFKFLSEFLIEFNNEEETINAYINRKKDTSLSVFLVGLEKFPFFDEIDLDLKKAYSNYKTWNKDLKDYYFIKYLLSCKHFNFAGKPKGILPFHKYTTHTATAVEEHLNEGAFYANSDGVAHLHFTISEEHQRDFESIIEQTKPKIEAISGVRLHYSFSYQHKITDTVAVDTENMPFRNDQGQLVFRPGGHGALINNLNELEADVVFIKNIDNVIQNHIETIVLYKKSLAGLLMELQARIFNYLEKIDANQISENDIATMLGFASEQLNIAISSDIDKYTIENKIAYLREILNRPIRVCGMVKNEGEPGGGPFWVREASGNVSLQIVETSQVDMQNPDQLEMLKQATHFNPVDIVCGIKDYKGNKFDLHQFVDHNSGFIVEKTKHGRRFKAYELPGLWNGAMAHWITVFVQVPLITFNPVKTVNDLLKPAHQPQ